MVAESQYANQEGKDSHVEAQLSEDAIALLKDASGEMMVKRFQDFPIIIGYKSWKCHMIITIIINTMVNFVFSLTSLIYTFNLLEELFPWSQTSIRLICFAVFLLVILIVIEPEKLKWMTTVTMISFMGIGRRMSRFPKF